MIEFRRGEDRFRSQLPGISTRHCFSSGAGYDPDNVAFGSLIAVDEHRVAPGAGFARHAHRGVAIVSWLLAGQLRHEDADGTATTVGAGAGLVQLVGAPREHAERNASATGELHFVQTVFLNGEDAPAVTFGPLPFAVAGGTYTVLDPSSASVLTGALVHAFVAAGVVDVGGQRLAVGDSVRIREDSVTIDGTGQLLVWIVPH